VDTDDLERVSGGKLGTSLALSACSSAFTIGQDMREAYDNNKSMVAAAGRGVIREGLNIADRYTGGWFSGKTIGCIKKAFSDGWKPWPE